GLYWYVNVPSPVVLSANTVYWIGAETFASGDYWKNAWAPADNPGFTQPAFAGFTYQARLYDYSFQLPANRIADVNPVIYTAANLLGEIPASPIAPAIVQQPQGAIRYVGDSVTMGAVGYGSSPVRYQWLKNGSNFSHW